MKRRLFFILICLLLFGSLVVRADLQQDVESNVQKIEDTQKKIEDIGSVKWDYLGKEWKNIFLKNKVISTIDAFFTKVSVIFEILIGIKYSFSLAFFFIVLVWFYLLFNLSYLMKTFFSKGISWVLSFLILLIFARIGFFPKVSYWAGKLFVALGNFINILPLLILVFVLIIWFLSYYCENFIRMIKYYFIKKTRQLREQQRRIDETLLHTTVQGLMNAFTRK